jgi:amino acid transporter
MLSGAVNTSIIGSNGVLNRVSEDGVLTNWFRAPQKKYGTTYRIINLIAILQIVTIIGSRGNIFILGEAYAFGVIWSFTFNAVATLVLRFRRPDAREWKVPGNITIGRKEIPMGLITISFVLLATALTNYEQSLFTRVVALAEGLSAKMSAQEKEKNSSGRSVTDEGHHTS